MDLVPTGAFSLLHRSIAKSLDITYDDDNYDDYEKYPGGADLAGHFKAHLGGVRDLHMFLLLDSVAEYNDPLSLGRSSSTLSGFLGSMKILKVFRWLVLILTGTSADH